MRKLVLIMVSLNGLSNKLDKMKKTIANNGILRIYVWIEEDEPIRLDLIYKNRIDRIYCYSLEEYVKQLYKHKGIEIKEFYGVKKPEPGDVAVA